MSINPSHQLIILARLNEFCQFHGHTLYHEKDPWEYMRRKLMETEEPLAALKSTLFELTRNKLLSEIRKGKMDSERCSDFRILFDRLLSPGDFADLAIHLDEGAPNMLDNCKLVLGHVKPTNLFLEERKDSLQKNPAWEKLVAQLSNRLELEQLGQLLARKARTRRRKAIILRRVRRNVAEYCAVMRIPTDPNEPFTPFMLPRVEGLIAANLRFLSKYR